MYAPHRSHKLYLAGTGRVEDFFAFWDEITAQELVGVDLNGFFTTVVDHFSIK